MNPPAKHVPPEIASIATDARCLNSMLPRKASEKQCQQQYGPQHYKTHRCRKRQLPTHPTSDLNFHFRSDSHNKRAKAI